uniref:Condensin-2 complex subunit H2 n=1 Tax=Mola mola TaxID=94237 RepID=A0A3Q4ASQ8_MOLML
MESTESRFAHLLQPIRDLAKNWDIDVASELNDYLEELEEMCITFDGGNTRLNFAEAALLIQGSACIYSKKVELLHSLVYQTLEYINDKNKKYGAPAQVSLKPDDPRETAGGRRQSEEGGGHACCMLTRPQSGNVLLFMESPCLTYSENISFTLTEVQLSVNHFSLASFFFHFKLQLYCTLDILISIFQVNKWKLHDPYVIPREDKPFKAGKCYKVPEGLDDGGKRKRKRLSSLKNFRSWFKGTFHPLQHKLKNGPTFTVAFCMILRSLSVCLLMQGVVVSEEELRRTVLQLEGEEPVDEFRQPDLLGKTTCLLVLSEQLVMSSRGYTQETALSQRVKDWEDTIRPELARQEESPVFDIHDYSDRVVAALSSVSLRRSFSSIVAGLDNFEACKYLLASLQLANDYTVEVDCVEGLEESLDSMGLTLLSTQRATDRFKTLTSST